jgi:P27 family predicted phage terminase small subunit
MPGWFTDAQAQVWERYAAQLRGMNLLYAADTDALVSLVLAVCQRDDAARVLQAEGLLTEGRRGGRVRHPATMILRQATADVVRLSREFGLTPNARDGLRLPWPPQAPNDPAGCSPRLCDHKRKPGFGGRMTLGCRAHDLAIPG